MRSFVELFAAAVGVERLAIEVIDAGAFDIAGARGFGLRAAVRVPALLPVGEPGLGVAQGVLPALVVAAAARRAAARHRRSRRAARRACASSPLMWCAEFGQRGLRFVARALQALRHFALVRDLLFDARQRAADLVDLGLRLVQRFAGFLAADAAGFDLALGFALLGDQLLQPGFFLRQLLAQRLQLARRGRGIPAPSTRRP